MGVVWERREVCGCCLGEEGSVRVLFGRGGKCEGVVWERREVCGCCLGEEGSVWVLFGRGGKCGGVSDFNTLGKGLQ